MINMQNSYSEGVGVGNLLSKPPFYSNNVRYQLAKQRVDVFTNLLIIKGSLFEMDINAKYLKDHNIIDGGC